MKIPNGISVNPMICSGTPCISGRRIPTHVIIVQFTNGDSIRAIAKAYTLTSSQVESAIRFEYRLKAKRRRKKGNHDE